MMSEQQRSDLVGLFMICLIVGLIGAITCGYGVVRAMPDYSPWISGFLLSCFVFAVGVVGFRLCRPAAMIRRF